MRYTASLAIGGLAVVLAGTPATATASGTGASAPVIRETFTVLPCQGTPQRRTTLELEGCAEHAVLRGDARINTLNRVIFATLPQAGRNAFVTATEDWVRFRDAECLAESSPEAGGSELPVTDALCLASEDTAHVGDLRVLQRAISAHG